ncbi:hypothetical protein RCO48_09205 [Peribacillus frigoritolerans]|nr:hypothetical protein [Peribacillus frigoritolerans]
MNSLYFNGNITKGNHKVNSNHWNITKVNPFEIVNSNHWNIEQLDEDVDEDAVNTILGDLAFINGFF